MPSDNGMIRTIWIIGLVVVLVPLVADWRTEAGTSPLSETKDVQWVDGGPNNPDLTRVSGQSRYIWTKRQRRNLLG
jgi:hypothetical protein